MKYINMMIIIFVMIAGGVRGDLIIDGILLEDDISYVMGLEERQWFAEFSEEIHAHGLTRTDPLFSQETPDTDESIIPFEISISGGTLSATWDGVSTPVGEVQSPVGDFNTLYVGLWLYVPGEVSLLHDLNGESLPDSLEIVGDPGFFGYRFYTDDGSPIGDAVIDGLMMRETGSSGNASFIYIGTYESVVPEPSTFALVIIGILLMCRRR